MFSKFKFTLGAAAILSMIACSSDSSTNANGNGNSNGGGGGGGGGDNFVTQSSPLLLTINSNTAIPMVTGFAEKSQDEYTIEIHSALPPNATNPWDFLAYDISDTNWTIWVDVDVTPGVYAIASGFSENAAQVSAKRYDGPEFNTSNPVFVTINSGSIRTTAKGTDSLVVEILGTGDGQVGIEGTTSMTASISGVFTIPIISK